MHSVLYKQPVMTRCSYCKSYLVTSSIEGGGVKHQIFSFDIYYERVLEDKQIEKNAIIVNPILRSRDIVYQS